MQECHESLEWMSHKHAKSLRKCLLHLCSWEFPVSIKCVQLRHGNLSTMTTYRNRPPFVALQNHSQHVSPYQFQRGGVILILSFFFFGGGRALSFDISILSRGQINFQPTPIFVNKNSSFALPELAFVICVVSKSASKKQAHSIS